MNCYLVIPNTLATYDGDRIKSPAIFDLLTDKGCWEYSARSHVFARLQKGDLLVFYLAGQGARYFAGEAVVAGPASMIAHDDALTFDREKVGFFDFRLPLRSIRRYVVDKSTKELLTKMSFFVGSTVPEKYVGLLLRNGICRLTTEDVGLIRARVAVESVGP